MNFLKRAYLHTVRQKVKTLLMLAVLLIIATMIQICVSIQTATDVAALNVRRSLMGSFTVNAKQLPMGLKDNNIAEICSIDGIKDNYGLRSYTHAAFSSSENGNALEIKTEGASEIPQGYENAGKIVGNRNSDEDTYFTEAGFQLVDGRAIKENDKNTVLVHEDFASRNHLSVGDTFVLNSLQDTKQNVQVQIIGIYTNQTPQDALGIAPSYDLYENIVFTDLQSCSQLDYSDGAQHYQYGDFYVDDPEQLESIISEAKRLPGVDWQNCVVTKYDTDYQNAKESLKSLQNMVFAATIAIVVVSILLVSLILSLWIKNRVHEIGALLAMGLSKVNILLQQTVEVFMIAILAFTLSFGVSSAIAQSVSDSLVEQIQSTDSVKSVDLINQTEHSEPSPVESYEINVVITVQDWLLVCVVGLGIIMVAILTTSYPLMRMKPKEILSKMS